MCDFDNRTVAKVPVPSSTFCLLVTDAETIKSRMKLLPPSNKCSGNNQHMQSVMFTHDVHVALIHYTRCYTERSQNCDIQAFMKALCAKLTIDAMYYVLKTMPKLERHISVHYLLFICNSLR